MIIFHIRKILRVCVELLTVDEAIYSVVKGGCPPLYDDPDI